MKNFIIKLFGGYTIAELENTTKPLKQENELLIKRFNNFKGRCNEKDIIDLYNFELLPRLEKEKNLQINLCVACLNSNEYISNYGQDTMVCDECGKTNDLVNKFLYDSILDAGFHPKNDWANNIPRIWHNEPRFNKARNLDLSKPIGQN